MEQAIDELVCPTCNKPLEKQYRGTLGNFLGCPNYPSCGHTVAVHQKTGVPLNFPAERHVFKHRHQAHKVFDRIWQSGFMSQHRAYLWLAASLKIAPEECHFSMFDVDTCKRALDICKKVNLASFLNARRIQSDRLNANKSETL